MTRNKNQQNKQYNKNYNQPKKPKLIPIGTKVLITVNHPDNKSRVYLCEARIVRQPRRHGDERYKLLVTAVQGAANEPVEFVKRILGMRILRRTAAISSGDTSTSSAWQNRQGVNWISLEEKEAQTLVQRAVNNIVKDRIIQQKYRPVPLLD